MVNTGAEAAQIQAVADQLARTATRPWTLMEVCGGQTHAILRWGLDQLLPAGLRLIHGPGCPVCVTPAETLDLAQQLALHPDVILGSYGDMLRVPGRGGSDLLGVRAAGGEVQLLTSPLQALALARQHPERQVVFLAVGFETTAPATAVLARQALAMGLANLSLLVAHVRVPPAMETILAGEGNRVQGFLAAGHVATVMGMAELEELVHRSGVPIVVTGFEPLDILAGVLRCVEQLEAGTAELHNAYGRVVRPEGNAQARALIREVFEPVDLPWRGFGPLKGGGLALRGPYRRLDARRRFHGSLPQIGTPPDPLGSEQQESCLAGLVLQGRLNPADCPSFGKRCTPEHPLGAPMVSSEGACAAYHRYRCIHRQPHD
ncbi:MAG: hydrogenase formation protein HypD [Cyanobacteriota bacterium]|nr:hydrogenase formation protein HypD [Cyanobacteriota bacterium]